MRKYQLCPFCDVKMPLEPSDELLDMMRAVVPLCKRGWSLDNPDSLDIDFTRRIHICRRHETESSAELQAEESKGWPQRIAWRGVWTRLKRAKMVERSISIIRSPRISYWYRDLLAVMKELKVKHLSKSMDAPLALHKRGFGPG
jgi:hypothetical protein